jgi:anti-sigma B factor antagonist
MKPENPAGVQGSRVTPVTAVCDKSLKLSLDAQTGGAVVLHCEGRIIFGPEARTLTEIIAEVMPSARRMVVDLTGVESMDSAGLGKLVLLHMWAGTAGYDLKFAGPRKSVKQLLELTNLLSVFDVHDSVADAVAAMHEQACSG